MRFGAKLSPTALHFAFLDPYSIQAMPFSIIQTLAELPRMDMLIHFSTMDMQRNIKALMAGGKLDNFAPGWQQHINPSERNDLALIAVFHYWYGLIRKLGYHVSDNIERISGAKNQPLYWLVLVSKNELGEKFWGKVSNVTPQQAAVANATNPHKIHAVYVSRHRFGHAIRAICFQLRRLPSRAYNLLCARCPRRGRSLCACSRYHRLRRNRP